MAVALILAAGSGERLGADRPKAFVRCAGRPLLEWSLQTLAALPCIEQIVVALPPGGAEQCGAARRGGAASQAQPAAPAAGAGPEFPDDLAVPAGTVAVLGGAVRSQSVKRALAVAAPSDVVLIHDAARPLLSGELAQAVIDTLDECEVEGAIAASPVTDTIKRAPALERAEAGGERPHGRVPLLVDHTLDRSGLWSVQTPQAFRRAALLAALSCAESTLAQATDDAWLLERIGARVAIVPAPAENIKVTTAVDLALAELLLTERA